VTLDLYFRKGLLDDRHPDVIELSELLNRLPIHTVRRDLERFRNPNGVALKLANFGALDPDYPGKGMTSGGRRDAEVFERFRNDRDEPQRIAGGIWSKAASAQGFPVAREEDEDEVEEGRLLYRQHRAYERDRSIVDRKKASARNAGAPLACEVCLFTFEAEYGELGRDFIECHHHIVSPLPRGEPPGRGLLTLPSCAPTVTA
jgi:5-methylcytosine-specific restriction protein A